MFWTRTRDPPPGTMRAFLHEVRHKLIWPALFSQVVRPFFRGHFPIDVSWGGGVYGTVGVAKLHKAGKRTAQQLQ